MRVEFIFNLFMISVALSGPVRRDCGQEKCYDAVNECGMIYGSCWTECSNGVMEMPTFTAPPCYSSIKSALRIDFSYTTQISDTVSNNPSPTDSGVIEAFITPPPSPNSAIYPSSVSVLSSCSPFWLCIENTAVCNKLNKIYGGCYDTCISAPPIESPPCTLSSAVTETGYVINTPTLQPAATYTHKPTSDSVGSTIDDSRESVISELSNASGSTATPGVYAVITGSITLNVGELRVAEIHGDNSEPLTAKIIEAPIVPNGGTMRGSAILKMMANKNRIANTPNLPCYEAFCKEAQLGFSKVSDA